MSTNKLTPEALLEPVFIASSYMADDDRPLAELTAVARLKQGVEFELKRCPYQGSRHDKLMNVSALPGLSSQIKNVITDAMYLRQLFMDYAGLRSMTVEAYWRFCRALDSLPVFIARHSRIAFDDENIPARVSAMFKAAQGLHLCAEIMVIEGMELDELVDTDLVIDFIESRGLFLDQDRACAGPLSMIRAFTESTITGAGKPTPDGYIETILDPCSAVDLFKYSDLVTDIFRAKLTYEAVSRLQLGRLVDQVGRSDLQLHASRLQARFGYLAKLSVASLSAVARHLTTTRFELNRTGRTLKNTQRLEKMLALRNPHLPIDVIRLLTKELIQSLAVEITLVGFLEQKQANIAEILSLSQDNMQFSNSELGGLGYTVAAVLAGWLKIRVQNSSDRVTVVAGISSETFLWVE